MSKRKRTSISRDIRVFFTNGGVQHKRVKMKSEDDPTSEDVHLHKFLLKFSKEYKKYTVQCNHQQTVLQAIRSMPELDTKIKCDENKIILWRGGGKDITGRAIATHFPCKLLEDGELITLKQNNQLLEVRDSNRDYTVDQNESYYVVNVRTKGGTRAKSKQLFRSYLLKNFSEICVYGSKDMTLKEAIERDGRFTELGGFKLEQVSAENVYVFSHNKIQQYEKKTFWICLENGKEAVSNKTSTDLNGASKPVDSEQACTSSTQTVTFQKEFKDMIKIPVSDLLKSKQSADTDEIYRLLQAQFPELKETLLKRSCGNDFQEIVRKVDFGKAHNTFSDVGRMRKLFKMGDAVCKISVGRAGGGGTGFVLFKHYILTCAHLFKGAMHNNMVRSDIPITAMFKYENYEQKFRQNTHNFKVSNTFIDFDEKLDYAILELEMSKGKVPPGLMKHCTEEPDRGEACIIGHPGGDVKKFDATCIIEKKDRENEVDKHLQQIGHVSVMRELKDQNIDRILYASKNKNDNVTTYNTNLLHGSSGSPVFDGECKVFGMHSGGFVYEPNETKSVIEFSRPLILILQSFVAKLRTQNNSDLLMKVEKELKDNVFQDKILNNMHKKRIQTNEDPMDI